MPEGLTPPGDLQNGWLGFQETRSSMDSTQRASAQYEALAEGWEAAGFDTPEDPSFGKVSRMYLWIHSNGAKREGVSERLRNYVGALQARLEKKYPGWYDAQFDDHDSCKICGERY